MKIFLYPEQVVVPWVGFRQLDDGTRGYHLQQRRCDRRRVAILEGVIDERPDPRCAVVSVGPDEDAGRPRPHDLDQRGEPGVERSRTTFVGQGSGEAVELLEVLETL